MIQKLAFFLMSYLKRWAKPSDEDLVTSLIYNTASLELTKGECIELAPIKGCCGPFKLYGNALPVFEYNVFEKEMMEFIKVRVEVSKPGRIHFLTSIDSINTSDPVRHGEEVETKEKYKEPFNKLAWSLFQYFPYFRKAK